jgi:hypothetical protein
MEKDSGALSPLDSWASRTGPSTKEVRFWSEKEPAIEVGVEGGSVASTMTWRALDSGKLWTVPVRQ